MIGLAAELTLLVVWARVIATCVLGAWGCRGREAAPASAADARVVAGRSARSVSVIVPAFDEAQGIGATLRSLLALVPAPLEIIVVDDGSSDATFAVARKCLAGVARSRVIRLPANAGKAVALQAGIAAASGELVLTVDADTRLAPGALAAALDTLQRRGLDALAFRLETEPAAGMLSGLQQAEYVASLDFERAAQDVVATIAVLPGAACLFRRELLVRHPFSTRTRTEDADLTLTLARQGARSGRAAGALAATLVPASWSELIRQRTRWTTGHVQCCARHATGSLAATWHFRLLVFPNFVLATFLAPAGLLALLALWAEGGARMLPLDAWDATVVSTVLVYVQRGIGVWAAPRASWPRLRHFALEPAFSGAVATLAFACAARDLLAGALQRMRGRAIGASSG